MDFSSLRTHRMWWIAGALIAIAIFVVLAALAGQGPPGAQNESLAPGESQMLRGQVLEVLEEGMLGEGEFQQPYQILRVRLTDVPLKGQEVQVEHGTLNLTSQSRLFRQGDRVMVQRTRTAEGGDFFMVTDLVRTGPLLWLTLFFVGATLLVSGWQGVRSLAGMAFSLLVIVAFIVPQILAGRSPIIVAVLGSVVMMGASLYLVYGWQRKTHVAVAGLFASLILTGLLALWSVNWTRLSGFGAEEAGFLRIAGFQLDPRGLLLAGIIIGSLGALDDVAIGQSSTIFQLARANAQLGWRALFRHGMVVGRDHIAAMVNTLLLAYVGASLPFLLLFSVYAEPLAFTLNREIIAEEIVQTLVGSLGLLAGVPLTSLIAALVARPPSSQPPSPADDAAAESA
jgi:uncharacterized membrane protein